MYESDETMYLKDEIRDMMMEKRQLEDNLYSCQREISRLRGEVGRLMAIIHNMEVESEIHSGC